MPSIIFLNKSKYRVKYKKPPMHTIVKILAQKVSTGMPKMCFTGAKKWARKVLASR